MTASWVQYQTTDLVIRALYTISVFYILKQISRDFFFKCFVLSVRACVHVLDVQCHLTWCRRGMSVRTADKPRRQPCPRYQTPVSHTHTHKERLFAWQTSVVLDIYADPIVLLCNCETRNLTCCTTLSIVKTLRAELLITAQTDVHYHSQEWVLKLIL